MSEKLTKRDVLLFGMMFFAPFLGFIACVWDDSTLIQMMDEPWLKVLSGIGVSLIWLGVWIVALLMDSLLKNMEKRKENVEFDDPSMAYGQYLFDKKKV